MQYIYVKDNIYLESDIYDELLGLLSPSDYSKNISIIVFFDFQIKDIQKFIKFICPNEKTIKSGFIRCSSNQPYSMFYEFKKEEEEGLVRIVGSLNRQL